MADPQGTPPPTRDVTTVSTLDVAPTPTIPATASAPATPAVASPFTPPPAGQPHAAEAIAASNPPIGVGAEGEETVWVGSYSLKNFVGRLTLRAVLTIALIVAAVYAWGYDDHQGLQTPVILFAIVMAVLWVGIILRIISAKLGYKYRITTRRLFISTGVFRRVRDQMELLRVKDLYMHQNTLLERLLQIGTVVVVPSDKALPTLHILGIDDPKGLMDLLWHYERAEQDRRSIKVENV